MGEHWTFLSFYIIDMLQVRRTQSSTFVSFYFSAELIRYIIVITLVRRYIVYKNAISRMRELPLYENDFRIMCYVIWWMKMVT